MKKFGKQSRDITLRRVGDDTFEFTLEVGIYYIDNVEKGIFISTEGQTVFFESFDEYLRSSLDSHFWEDMLCKTPHEQPITDFESSVLVCVVDELRRETETGINQLYLDDETFVDGVFDMIFE